MIGFSTAMVLFGVVALLAWTTLPDERIRITTLLVLGLFALRTWSHHRRQMREQRDESATGESQLPDLQRVEATRELGATGGELKPM